MTTNLVTVFGGSGFLGRHTVRALARAGWRIKVATRHPNRAFFLRPLGTVGQIDFVKCDVADAESVARAIMGSKAVINLTGILFQKGQTFEDVQAEGAANIAKAAAAAGVSALVHVSAIGADKDSDAHYAVTKAEGEEAIRQAFPNAVILRPSLILGPKMVSSTSSLRWLGCCQPCPGWRRSHPLSARFCRRCVPSGPYGAIAADGRAYELGGPTIYTFKELMQLILRETGRKRVLVPLPFIIATFKAMFLQLLPNPLLTVDQVRLLKKDNVVSPTAAGLSNMGITPTSVEAVVPSYLWRYRAKGEYADMQAVRETGAQAQ